MEFDEIFDSFTFRAFVGIGSVWIHYGMAYGLWRIGGLDRWVEQSFFWISTAVTGIYVLTFLACNAIVGYYCWRRRFR